MRLTYLGTSAAEGCPAMFCDCEVCETARKLGGKNIRTRSQALVNDDLLLDFPPDTYAHVLTHGVNLRLVQNILVTHLHEDHFYPDDLMMRIPPFAAKSDNRILNIYGNERVVSSFQDTVKRQWNSSACKNYLSASQLEAFTEYSIGNYTVHPLLADHDRSQHCLFYAIFDRESGKSLLYAHDTGYFFDQCWSYMQSRAMRFDLVSLDCTHQLTEQRSNHMGLNTCAEVRGRMLSSGLADEGTVFMLNHFSHNGRASTHDMMDDAARRFGMRASYDGLALEL